jgi:uroporphyrinogen-III synthase
MTLRLKNKLFISTRPTESSSELTTLLSLEGATVLELPLIETKAAEITIEEKKYFLKLYQFYWVIFTSINGVRYFFDMMKEQTGSYYLPPGLKLAVIGSKTENRLKEYGYTASFVNPGSTAEEFSVSFLPYIENYNSRPVILLPLGNLARTIIQDYLKDIADCVRINIYKTVIPEYSDPDIIQRIRENRYDMIIFTSPSGIQNFLSIMPEAVNKNIRMACIGQVTYREAVEKGFDPVVTALKSSSRGIIDSILNYYISKT